MINFILVLSIAAELISFFAIPDYNHVEVEYLSTAGIALLVSAIVTAFAIVIHIYFRSAHMDIKLAGFDAKKRLYEQIEYGFDTYHGYEYQRWQADVDVVKMNEWLEREKTYYCHWWNFDITTGVKMRLKNMNQVELKF